MYGTQQTQDALLQNTRIAQEQANAQAELELRRNLDAQRQVGRVNVENLDPLLQRGNAQANANNARQIAALNAQGLNNMYANAANNLQLAANTTQNNLANVSSGLASGFR